jgi:hypothetical protein
MTSADPLAHERFRTIVSDCIHDLDLDYDGLNLSTSDIVRQFAAEFPEAHFEYRTNEAGVRLRKVVVESGWEVDLALAADGKPYLNPLDENETESYYDRMAGPVRAPDADCVTRADGECVSTKSCMHVPHRAAPWHA